MEVFPIDPNDCLVLKALNDSKSLREAALLLKCDPAGLARKAQSISQSHGYLQKVNNRWQVTSRGLDLIAWLETSIQQQKKALSLKSSLRIGSTMWFSEEIIVPHLPKLIALLGKNSTISLSAPEKGFEASLIEGSLDFIIACHPPENPEIEHKYVGAEKWVIAMPKSWRIPSKDLIPFLQEKPFIPHSSINLDVFLPSINNFTYTGVVIDNLIGIRSAIRNSIGWSIVPKILIRHDQEDSLIDIAQEIAIPDRKICLWWLRNRHDLKRQSAKISNWLKDATGKE